MLNISHKIFVSFALLALLCVLSLGYSYFISEQVHALAQEALEIQDQDSAKLIHQVRLATAVSLVLILGFTIISLTLLWFHVGRPVHQAISYLKDTEHSSFFQIPFTDRQDEIGDLTRSFQNILIARETSQAKLREQAKALVTAKETAEKASHAKSDFLANMSHELRTPLNSIIGITQIIDPQKLDQNHLDMFKLIKNASDNLLFIVNDILDISKIEAGEVELEYIAFNPIAKARHATRTLMPITLEKGIDLSFETNIDHLYALGDSLRFERILINLINNAISYTNEGGVKVTMEVKKIHGDVFQIRCEVKDTGIGIPRNKLNKIFDKFTQGDSSITRKYGGTGLGLAITKQLVELMDGQIGVESIEGEGSTFWFEIPFETVKELIEVPKKIYRNLNEQNHLEANIISAEKARILMAEDHKMNQVFMEKLFAHFNIKNYKIVENGKAALEEVQTKKYDLVLMDCHMPEMNGYDATINIRELSDPIMNAIPIVAMTANAMPEDEDKCLSIGMDAYISKPVKIETFIEKLSPWISFVDDNSTEPVKDGLNTAKPTRNIVHDIEEDIPVDLTSLKKSSMGDEDFVTEIVKMFIEQGKQQIKALERECNSDQNSNWVEIAHALKGTAGGIGAEKLRQLSAEAQNLKNPSQAEKENILQKITAEYERAKVYLDKGGLF